MIRPASRDDARRLAEIDAQARPGDVLPAFGPRFLAVLYDALLSDPDVAAVVYEGDRVLGFVLGCADTGSMMRRAVRRRWLALLVAALPACAIRPRLVVRAWQSLHYPRQASAAGAELLVIAVDPAVQRRGLGGQLIAAWCAAMRSRGQTQCHLTVDASNAAAIRFYERLGWRPTGELMMYGRPWRQYLCDPL